MKIQRSFKLIGNQNLTSSTKTEEISETLNETLKKERLSYEEHRENAQAPRAEEGRDKLRKAMVRSKYPHDPQISE